MTLRHFQIFTAVVDHKTMHQAAENLFISQPGISQAIRELENQYQITLFERYKKRLILTREGEKLLVHCRMLLAQYDSLNQAMQELKAKPVIRVGATVTIGEEILVGIVLDYEKKHPNIRIEVIVNNTEAIEQLLLEGRLDVGLIEGQVVSGDLKLISLFDDCMQVVANVSHPLSGKKNIQPLELSEYDIITREQGSQVRNVLLNALSEQGIPVRVKWSCTNVHTIKQAVMSGQGISVLSSLTIQKEVEEGLLCVLDVEGLDGSRMIHLVHHRDKHIGDAQREFMEYIRMTMGCN